MATPPTFSVGQILTAAQMNAVGLWLVKSQTIGSGVSSVTVTGAFSADYDNYLIVVTGGTISVANADIGLQMASSGTPSTTGYYSTLIYGPTLLAFNVTNGTSWLNAGGGTSTDSRMRVELEAPFLAQRTTYFSKSPRIDIRGTSSGYHDVASSYDSFVLVPNPGTLTGGTIRVYGYRK
jgi:hypothetical protein